MATTSMKTAAQTKLPTCSFCGEEIPFHVRDCIACGNAVGFPNVRAAESSDERLALQRRVLDAQRAATLGNYAQQLAEFGSAVSLGSHATLAKSLHALDAFLSSGNQLLSTFYKMVRAEARYPQDNRWDRTRKPADATINPLYEEEIQFAALSLTGKGVDGYGGYFLCLKDIMIQSRSSCFEENPILFCDKWNVNAGSLPPPGFRATWAERGELAKAKLFQHIRADTEEKDFPGILVRNGDAPETRDFIEVHIYGPLALTTIERVFMPPIPTGPDRHVWRAVQRRLKALSVPVEEY